MVKLSAAEEGYVTEDVYLNTHKTVYSRIGNAFVYVCLAACTALVAIAAFGVVKQKTNDYNKNKIKNA